MIISQKHKFVFISKPRCASTKIRQLLRPYADIISSSEPPYHHHATALELKLHFDRSGWDWNDYFVFTTVRNPWDMMVSYYSYFKPDVNGIYNYEKDRGGISYQPDRLSSFKEWIRRGKSYHRLRFVKGKMQKNIWVNDFSKITLANTVNDQHGKCLADEIVKVEDLEDGMSKIFRMLGLGKADFATKTNCTERSDYRTYYKSDETREKVAAEFESDIRCGFYVF